MTVVTFWAERKSNMSVVHIFNWRYGNVESSWKNKQKVNFYPTNIVFIPSIRLLAHPSCSRDCLETKDADGRTPIMVAVQAMSSYTISTWPWNVKISGYTNVSEICSFHGLHFMIYLFSLLLPAMTLNDAQCSAVCNLRCIMKEYLLDGKIRKTCSPKIFQCGNLGCVKHLVGKHVDLGKDVKAWTLHDAARW